MRRAAKIVLFPLLGVAALLLAERVFESVDRRLWREFEESLALEAREFMAELRCEWD